MTRWAYHGVERNEYDQPLCIRQPGGRITQIKRDYAGRILSETDQNGRKREWQRDESARLRHTRTTAPRRCITITPKETLSAGR
ncbi:hypothetical protein ACVXG8_12520 [Escherichia coli]